MHIDALNLTNLPVAAAHILTWICWFGEGHHLVHLKFTYDNEVNEPHQENAQQLIFDKSFSVFSPPKSIN